MAHSTKLRLRSNEVTVSVVFDGGKSEEVTMPLDAFIDWLLGKPLHEAAPNLSQHQREILIESFRVRS